jgi:hypothetical protein
MPLVYCDSNFIITAAQGPEPYKAHLRQLSSTGVVTFVLSPFLWVDLAEDANVARAEATADFIDSLGAQWIRERRNIEGKEVVAAFFRYVHIPLEDAQMVVSFRDVIADLAGRPGDRPSRDFVAHLRGIGQNHPLKENLDKGFATNQKNTTDYNKGTFTPEFRRRVETEYVRQLLPARTPAGLEIDLGSKRAFLDAQQLTDFPSLCLETRGTYDNWDTGRQLTRNNFIDQQHVMALPYVDFFVTDDGRLTTLIGRIVNGVPFRCATVITQAQFDCLYPPAA